MLDHLQRQNEIMQKKQKLNNSCCTLVACVYNIMTLVFITYPCFTGRSLDTINLYTTAFMFSILGIMFLVYGVGMNLALKHYFPHFYISFRCFLWTACFCLAIPLFLRFFIDALRAFSPSFTEWYNSPDTNYITNTAFLVLTTYVPILTQMSSLVFGYLRKKQEETMHLNGEQKEEK